MQLSPVIVIPTYWCGRRASEYGSRGPAYDHMTPLDREGELPRCLESLRAVKGLGRIAILVASEEGIENQAFEKVREIAARFPDLQTIIVGDFEMRHIHRRLDQMGLGGFAQGASLSGYGAIRNLGVLVASIFAHDTVVFIDDDEVISDPDFLEKALYGIGAKTPNGSIIVAKSGFFLDASNEYLAPEDTKWYHRFWDKSHSFNKYMKEVIGGPRLSRANTACGGCMVLHADAYGTVAFDPWITRGEDLDYVISARMYGIDLWFDNQLSLKHLPMQGGQPSLRFEQDVYRWFYEYRKVEFAKTQIDLLQITPHSLEPYPGSWLSRTISRRAQLTAYMAAIGHKDHLEYLRIGNSSRKDASRCARENCGNYFEYQRQWPAIVRGLWNCTPLATQLSGVRSAQGGGSPAFTGRFSAVVSAEGTAQTGEAESPVL